MSENVPTVKSLRNVLIRALGAAMDGAGVPVLPDEEFDRQKQILSDLIDALLADVALRHDFHRWLVQHDAELLRRHADFIRERDEAGEWTRASSAAIYLYEEANATTTEGSK